MSCNADVVANNLLESLLAGKDFTVPNVELNADSLKLPAGVDSEMYANILRLNVSDLTEEKVGGAGAFDSLMTSVKAHLREEYEKGRITGAEYTKAYAELVTASMSHATQFVLGKDQVYWTSQLSQIQAVTARLQMESERVRLAALKFDALTSEANYALTKLKLANEDAQYCINKYNLDQMLPAQKALLDAQVLGQTANNDKVNYELAYMLPKQSEGLGLVNDGKLIENNTATYNLTSILPKQSEGLGLTNDGKIIENNTATYNLATILPKQAAMLEAQRDGQLVQNDQGRYTLQNLMPAQLEKLVADIEGVQANTDIAQYNLSVLLPTQHLTAKYTLEQMMPSQKAMVDSQKQGQDIANQVASYNKEFTVPQQFQLLKEQTETQRAQTADNRSDGAAVVGYVGKQKDLYSQQIDSFKRDAEIKAAKLVSDGWMTQKTIDEAALTPASFQQNMVDAVLQRVKTNNGLG